MKAGEWLAVGDDIAAVRAAASVLLKVILETACLTDDEVVEVCRGREGAGADYVKTSTGFHPPVAHRLDAVATMHAPSAAASASRPAAASATPATALAMLDAGATRLGCSATRERSSTACSRPSDAQARSWA